MNNENSADFIIDVKCGIDTSSPQISQYSSNFGSVKFLLDKNLSDYTVMIVSEIDGETKITETDGTNLIKSIDEKSGNTILVWNIGREITAQSGAVIYQIAAYKLSDNEITSRWYSKEGRLFVSQSINTSDLSTALVGSNPDILTRILLKISALDESVKNKVDKSDGMGLSENSFTNAEKQKLAGVETGADVNMIETIKINGNALTADGEKNVNIDLTDYALKSFLENSLTEKVDKENGKSLSENSFTDSEKLKLAEIEANANVNTLEKIKINGSEIEPDAEKTINIDISDYAKKDYVENKLNSYETTNDISTKLAGYTLKEDFESSIAKKVDKVDGKDLSTNDFNDSDKAKLDGIETGAQANVIEAVRLDGQYLPATDKEVSLTRSIKPVNIIAAEGGFSYFNNITDGAYKYSCEDDISTDDEVAFSTTSGYLFAGSYSETYGGSSCYQLDINGTELRYRMSTNGGGYWSPWTILSSSMLNEYAKSNELTAKVRAVRPASAATIPTTLSANTIYDIGTQTAVSLKLPKGQLGDFIHVDFLTGSAAATVTVDATSCAISDFDLITEANTIYSLYFDWGVLGYDSTNSKYIYGWRFSDSEYTYSGGNT